MAHSNTLSLDGDLELSLGEALGLSRLFWSGEIGKSNTKLTPNQHRVIEETRNAVQKNMEAMGL